MQTKPLYLEDPYLKTLDAHIVEVIFEKEGVYRLVLDQTIFYPMGGGQPTDQGTMTTEEASYEVYQVLLKEGEIHHYVKTAIEPTVGAEVSLAIDWDRRYKNMKWHSGGHVVDFAIFLLGYSPQQLTPLKGDHGKKPFIVYGGNLGKDIKEELQAKVNELIEKNLKFSWSFEMLENIEKEVIYLQPGLPKNKPLRALRLESVGTVADGGTIVNSTQEVGRVTVTTIESSDTETKVSYAVS